MTKSRKLSAHGRPTIAMIVLRAYAESRAQRSFRKQIAIATAEFEKSTSRTRNEWHNPFVSALPSIFQILFPETGCHAKTRLPDQRLWQPARPYLLIINRHARSVLPILPSPIFKKMAKQAHQHIHSTILTHNVRAQNRPTLGKTSRDASDTRAWHATLIL